MRTARRDRPLRVVVLKNGREMGPSVIGGHVRGGFSQCKRSQKVVVRGITQGRGTS